jgi:hypothetical protein
VERKQKGGVEVELDNWVEKFRAGRPDKRSVKSGRPALNFSCCPGASHNTRQQIPPFASDYKNDPRTGDS